MNNQKAGHYFTFGIVLAALIALADQISKWWMLEYVLRPSPETPGFMEWMLRAGPLDRLENYTTIALTPFMNIVMVWNEGVSFGLFSGAEDKGLAVAVLVGIALAVSACVLFVLSRTVRRLPALGLAMILGGAAGNIVDRLRFGAVADFVDVYVGRWHWPAFNLADSAIVIGAVFLMLDAFLTPGDET